MFYCLSPGLVLCLCLLLAFPAWSHPHDIVITDEVQLGLGDAFMADGEYYRAATEYMKFLYLFPESKRVPYALLQLGMAHYRGGEYQRAIDYFAKVRASYDPTYFTTAAFYEGLCYEQLNQPGRAQDAFERALAFDPTGAHAGEALVGKSLSEIGTGNLTGGRQDLERYAALYAGDRRTAAVAESLSLLDQHAASSRKSPLLAASLSAVLPGSGQMYAGRARDGLTALLVNGLFIVGTVVAIDQENYAVAAIVGGVGLPFYLGNIYGAANAANQWNLSLRRDLRNTLAVTLGYRY